MNTITIDNIRPDGAVCVLMQTKEAIDGEEVTVNHRISFIPTESERARKFLPDDIYDELMKIWTPEIVKAWEEKQFAHGEDE